MERGEEGPVAVALMNLNIINLPVRFSVQGSLRTVQLMKGSLACLPCHSAGQSGPVKKVIFGSNYG